MQKCPQCKVDSKRITKEWNYGIYHVENHYCAQCKKTFNAYYNKGKLSHIIESGTAAKTYYGILRYVKYNENATTDDIAKALNLDTQTVVRMLESLEKNGKIKDSS